MEILVPAQTDAAAALADEKCRRVVRALGRKRLHQDQLAKRTGLSAGSLSRSLDRLVAAELVEHPTKQGAWALRDPDAVRKYLRQVAEAEARLKRTMERARRKRDAAVDAAAQDLDATLAQRDPPQLDRIRRPRIAA